MITAIRTRFPQAHITTVPDDVDILSYAKAGQAERDAVDAAGDQLLHDDTGNAISIQTYKLTQKTTWMLIIATTHQPIINETTRGQRKEEEGTLNESGPPAALVRDALLLRTTAMIEGSKGKEKQESGTYSATEERKQTRQFLLSGRGVYFPDGSTAYLPLTTEDRMVERHVERDEGLIAEVRTLQKK